MEAMGALNSTVRKKSTPDWIAPTSSRKCNDINGKLFVKKLANIRWRKKCRQISREDQRAFRALISHWTSSEISAFLTEMESAYAVQKMTLMAEKARPSSSFLAVDLLNAWKNEVVTDCFIIHKNIRYAVHSFMLRARCRHFSNVWDSMVTQRVDNGKLEVPFIDDSISSVMFQAMLYFIYTGDYDKSLLDNDRMLFNTILQRYGCGSSLSDDLIAFNCHASDCTLVFTSANNEEEEKSCGHNEDYRIQCSAAVLAARSSYLRSLIEKRISSKEKLEITVSEHLFPRIYSNCILDAIYTDRLDLNKISQGCQMSASSLSEVQAIASGKRHIAPLRHAIDIFHISQFLNLLHLVQVCEDIIVSQMSIETVGSLWNWACESGGSLYVRRHCIIFLCSEFSRISSSHLLFELEEELIGNCLLSDYVQCAEVKILEAVIRWGEHELVRRMEEREPNLIANTTHSISRKGIRRSELNDEELRNILANILPLVRVDYILPPFHESLNAAYKRGLLDRSPDMDLLGQQYPDSRSPDVNPDAHWFDHSVPRRHAAGPRFLLPYILEAHKQLKRLCGNGGIIQNLSILQQKNLDRSHFLVKNLFPEIISESLQSDIEKRIKELARDDLMNKVSCCGCPHHIQLAVEQIRRRVLREFNISEDCIEVIYSNLASKREAISRCYCSQPILTAIYDVVDTNADISLSSATIFDFGHFHFIYAVILMSAAFKNSDKNLKDMNHKQIPVKHE